VRSRLLLLIIPVSLTILCGIAVHQRSLAQSRPRREVELRIIVVSSPTDAEEILGRLKKGADFATLAKQKSTDPTAAEGGSMGRTDPATLRSELRDAVNGLAPGQLSEVIKIPSGYAILRMESQTTASKPAQPASGNPSGMLPLSSRGNVRYPPDVAGAVDAELAFRNFPKEPGWSRDLHKLCELRTKFLPATIRQLEGLLDPANPDAPKVPMEIAQAHYALAQLHAYQGQMDEAIEQWQAAYKIALSDVPALVSQMEEVLGIAYLHKSEMENDGYRNPGERCLFPPRTSVAYENSADSKKAVEYFSKYLEKKPNELEVQWLLNLAYMSLGGYPASVPGKYLIRPSVFESQEELPRFEDVAPLAGINTFSMAGGTIVDDFDNDGLLDIVTSSYDSCEPLHLFHNNGDGSFTDRNAQAGLLDQLGGLNIIQADYNNDGCMDILVPRGAWQYPIRRSLLRNNCDGTFTDVTQQAGLEEPETASQAVVWADIDNDGWLDLFIGNEQGPSQLFRNKGDGTFENISHFAGVDRSAFSKAVVAADYDNDGYVDFYVSNLNGDNFLYHNNHDRTFTEVAGKAGVQEPWTSFAAWFFDYDNDGWPDLFVTSYYLSVDEDLRSYLGLEHNAETLKLYRNLGNGSFRDVTAEVGLDRVFMPMGSNFGDIDNDGFLDIYLGTGNPTYGSLLPNVLLRNKEGKSFVDVTGSSGTGELHKGHGVAFADIDNDGDEDLLAEIGGAIPGDRHAFRLFENPGNSNDWISLKLVGVKSNRAAIGARIKLTVGNEGRGPRSIYRTVGSGGSFGANPLQQHIGLGKSAQSVSLEIWWPGSNTRQNFSDIAKNHFLEIREFAKEYNKLERHPFRLGGPKRSTMRGTNFSWVEPGKTQ
jgi:tetratricopeptide (TPR) repeat protein